ncbi:FAD-dependent oxidoreductase [Mycolicibacterium palauense]|uniref:FAD-dependent oxidoreductase n=1 Tax=Mycolicibacterium palauense TaxID=2034511 RepID=UPI000BFF15BE|nr:FAD-dependent oxidoreductase [Mycolicibacterium palauense]
MSHVITGACCNDAACVAVCPVNCIHPAPGTAEFATAEILYVDPRTCIDCGACVEVCPVDAVGPDYRLAPARAARYRDLSAAFFADYTYDQPGFLDPVPAVLPGRHLSVGVVGSGPAAAYAVEALLEACPTVEVHVYERLVTPWGLVRYGVAPDHQDTKNVTRGFERIMDSDQVRVHLNVEVGTHVSHDELMQHHHAVLYAVGASQDRSLGVPGEDLANCHSAREFVAWYNGHPEAAGLNVDLTHRRAVVVGNGNVALDVARVLAMDIDALACSDIADHALAALRRSEIEEIVVLGRRGPAEAAYTTPELLALADTPGVDLVVELPTDPPGPIRTTTARVKAEITAELSNRPHSGSRRVVLRYLTSPVEILGADSVHGIRVVGNELVVDHEGTVRARATQEVDEVECGLVLRAVGYRGAPQDGLPFDAARGVLPHRAGRLMDGEREVTGVYTAGWIKRGSTGVIGTNRGCAQETVASLLGDFAAGRLPNPGATTAELESLLAQRQPLAVTLDGWHRLDVFERTGGRRQARPRVKVVDAAKMASLATAH